MAFGDQRFPSGWLGGEPWGQKLVKLASEKMPQQSAGSQLQRPKKELLPGAGGRPEDGHPTAPPLGMELEPCCPVPCCLVIAAPTWMTCDPKAAGREAVCCCLSGPMGAAKQRAGQCLSAPSSPCP